MFKRHEEEHVYTYVWVKPWLEGKFDIMKASISVVRKINYDGTVFSSHQERSPVHLRMSLSPFVFLCLLLLSLSCIRLFAIPWTAAHQTFPSLTLPSVCLNSCPLMRGCCSAISFPTAPFSFCLQSFSASGSFPINQLFASGGQSIGASALAPVLPMNIQGIDAK